MQPNSPTAACTGTGIAERALIDVPLLRSSAATAQDEERGGPFARLVFGRPVAGGGARQGRPSLQGSSPLVSVKQHCSAPSGSCATATAFRDLKLQSLGRDD
eukprot:s5077_g2.t1